MLRAKDICRALGVGTTANHTESLRAKLKRLVARGVLTEAEPGPFTLAQPATSSPDQRQSHNGHSLTDHPLRGRFVRFP